LASFKEKGCGWTSILPMNATWSYYSESWFGGITIVFCVPRTFIIIGDTRTKDGRSETWIKGTTCIRSIVVAAEMRSREITGTCACEAADGGRSMRNPDEGKKIDEVFEKHGCYRY
jgi:hypothetical protein